MRWWETAMWERNGDQHHQHVLPLDDAIEHSEEEDCICGPRIEPIERADGSIAWLVTHHSLDGRELAEPRDGGAG